MKLSLHLQDDQYPFTGLTNTRKVARAIIFNELGEVATHHIHRDDQFGCQSYLETPGGGVDEGESYEMAVERECLEELGAHIEVLECLGSCEDAYNLIKRKNLNKFYLCRLKDMKAGKHLVSRGDSLIEYSEWLPIDRLLEEYARMPNNGVSILVKRRETPFLKLAKSRIAYYLKY